MWSILESILYGFGEKMYFAGFLWNILYIGVGKSGFAVVCFENNTIINDTGINSVLHTHNCKHTFAHFSVSVRSVQFIVLFKSFISSLIFCLFYY